MLNTYRNKLLNAILFFSKNTRHCNKTKLLKLLYHLDFIHFKQTGFPSIGLTYYTYKEGPVPVRFWKEIQHGEVPPDFRGKFEIKIAHYPKPTDREYTFVALVEPDLSVFSPRERRILTALANTYQYKSATQISEATHLPRQPWHTTKVTSGLSKPIDYLLSLDEQTDIPWDKARENLSEFYAAIKNFDLRATRAVQS
ncbi:MAG: Panacea domain-containing protein [Dehalococcoidales bacterium]